MKIRMPNDIISLASRRLVLSLLPLLCVGCNIMGFVADKTTTGEQKDAEYNLAKEPMVVIAENWKNPSGTAIDNEAIEREVSENLTAQNIGPQIDPIKVMDLKSERPDYGSLSIAQIGKLVGAKQVIYINMTNSSLIGAIGSDSLKGKATARIKVIDVATGAARWPTDSVEGYPISISLPDTATHSAQDENDMHEKLIAAAADRISKIFYKAPADDDQ
jgi:hypothetical protein